MQVTAIIAAAGAGRRLGAPTPKQMLEIGGRPILQRSVEALLSHPRIHEVVVALPAEIAAAPPDWLRSLAPRVTVVPGGARRQDSVANAFAAIDSAVDVVIVHDAARPFVTGEIISRAIDAAAQFGAAIAGVPATDTVKRVARRGGEAIITETIPRETIFLAQTPQAFRRDVLRAAVALGQSGIEATDEAALAERAGHAVHVVAGDPANVKITTETDLMQARERVRESPRNTHTRVGTGYDLHRLVEGRALVIGGVTVPSDRGALGHSDADVVCHAATDAILGAACLGDIGRHFPDSDPKWKGASSIELLGQAAAMVRDAGFDVVNADVVVVLERPKISPFVDRIRTAVAAALGVHPDLVSVKGKTNEGMDAIGRGDAIAAHAIALLAARSGAR